MRIGSHDFDLINKAYIMGILNLTPDSFSDGGKYTRIDDALFRAEEMVSEGASIIDIGGESTRPGHIKITAEEEIARIIPVIEALKRNIDIPLSLDTWKHEVAAAGISAGADMINDVNGLLSDEGQMAKLLAASGLPCCLMHNGRLASMQAGDDRDGRSGDNDGYAGDNWMKTAEDNPKKTVGITQENTVGDIKDHSRDIQENKEETFLKLFSDDIDRILEHACDHGISREQIILDPGIGFGESYEQDLIIMKNLSFMRKWGLPVLLGTSRKRMIGHGLNLPVEDREEGTMATTVIGRMAGVSIFRVHNVKGNYRALMMTDIINQIRL